MRCGETCCGSCALSFRLLFQALFLPFQQVVEFFDQLKKAVVVPFLFDQCAQLVHAFSVIGFHRRRQMTPPPPLVLR
jgi:hypothetical protein